MWGVGILKGMLVTLKNLFRGPITVQYPDERLELPERSRWAVAPLFDEEGKSKCTACMACVRACPDHILELRSTMGEDKRKHIDEFTYEVGACMFCGLCVEACAFGALCMSKDYELATRDAEGMTVTLLQDVPCPAPKRAAAADKKPVAKPAADAGAAAPTAPAAPEAQPAPAEPVPAPAADSALEATPATAAASAAAAAVSAEPAAASDTASNDESKEGSDVA